MLLQSNYPYEISSFFTVVNINFHWYLLPKLLLVIIISRFYGPKLQKILQICLRSFVNFEPELFLYFKDLKNIKNFFTRLPKRLQESFLKSDSVNACINGMWQLELKKWILIQGKSITIMQLIVIKYASLGLK